jgi:transmembrane sensor
MNKPAQSVPRLSPRWTEDHSARVRAALERRSKRRRAIERSGAALGLVTVVGLVAIVAFRLPRIGAPAHSAAVSAEAVRAPSPAPSAGKTADVTTLLDPNSEVVPEPHPHGRAFRLVKGAARFAVVHDTARPFRVSVGSAVVEDVGTVFSLRRLSNAAAEVSVDEGRVRVTATDGTFDVGAGERRTFAIDAQGPDATEPEARTPRVASVAPWRPLAENGRFGEAYVAMKATGPSSVRDEAGELLLAADVARMSGHPAEAVPYLERLLRSRASDPRAGLAAFTLGRVLLEDLGRPAEAASAFGRARRAGGPLAEDALARQVEALSRAGDPAGARSLALDYRKAYPNGRRIRRVVQFGGLD